MKLPFDVFAKSSWLYKNDKVKLKNINNIEGRFSYFFECNNYEVKLWNQEVGDNMYKWFYSCTCANQVFAGAKYNVFCCHVLACMVFLTIYRGYKK